MMLEMNIKIKIDNVAAVDEVWEKVLHPATGIAGVQDVQVGVSDVPPAINKVLDEIIESFERPFRSSRETSIRRLDTKIVE